MNGIADPFAEGVGSEAGVRTAALIAEDGIPLHGEVVSVVGRIEKALNGEIAFVGIGIRDEGLEFGRGGESAGDIESYASEESRIVAKGSGGDAERVEFLKDGLVDRVSGGGERSNGGTEWDAGLEDSDLSLEASHDGDIARHIVCFDQAGRGNFGHIRLIRFVLGCLGDVFEEAVAVFREHGELLLTIAEEALLGWKEVDPNDFRIIAVAVGHGLCNPATEEAILLGVGLQTLSAAVRGSVEAFG